MKVRALANGDIVDMPEATATGLIEAGIYEPVAEQPKPPSTPESEPPAPKKSAPEKSTKVEPMTTEDMPAPPKKVK